jgi:hypothetical protein
LSSPELKQTLTSQAQSKNLFIQKQTQINSCLSIMRPVLLAVLGLMVTSSLAAPGLAAQEGISAFDAVAKLKSGPHVYVHIADDGVARAYDENESVIDYVPLTNDQLKQLLANLPEPWKKEADHLHAVFDDVDGRQVTDEKQLLDPPAELRNPMPRQAPQSKRAPDPLQQSDYYCRGQPCTNDPACQFMGCAKCAHMDAILPGGAGVCI